MSRNTIKWLSFIIGTLALSSLTCTIWDQLGGAAKLATDVPPGHHFCHDLLVIPASYTVSCDEDSDPKVLTYSGSLSNVGIGYAHDVSFNIYFGRESFPYCEFRFDQIDPGETVQLICQVEYLSCSYSIVYDYESCKYLTYTEHLDLISEDNPDENQDIDSEDSPIPEDEIEDLIESPEALLEAMIDLSGIWKGTCPSLLPDFYCMPDDADCTETNERTFAIDLNKMTYEYENPWSYFDRHDEFWEGTYDHCTGSNTSQGVIFDDGWMIGIINFDEKCEYTTWLFGTTEGDQAGLRQGEREHHRDAVFIARILFDPEPAVAFTVYASDQTFPIEEYTNVPEAFKRLTNEYATVCPIIPSE